MVGSPSVAAATVEELSSLMYLVGADIGQQVQNIPSITERSTGKCCSSLYVVLLGG